MDLTQTPRISMSALLHVPVAACKMFKHCVFPSAYTYYFAINLLLGLLPECCALLWCLFVDHMVLCTADAFVWLYKTRDWSTKYL